MQDLREVQQLTAKCFGDGWWPRHTPSMLFSPANSRITSHEMPASLGSPGPGEMMILSYCAASWMGEGIVTKHPDPAFGLHHGFSKVVQVVGEGVVIVNDEDVHLWKRTVCLAKIRNFGCNMGFERGVVS